MFLFLFLLLVLVARVKPKWYLKSPKFKKASKRVDELGEKTVARFMKHAEEGTLPKNLLGDIMRAHIDDPEFVQKRDLAVLLTGPYVAGLDTVANTVSGAVYGILKTPGVLEKVQAEADALYAKGTVTSMDVRNLDYIQGCICAAGVPAGHDKRLHHPLLGPKTIRRGRLDIDVDAGILELAHGRLARVGPSGRDHRDGEFDAGRHTALGNALAHRHDVYAERPRRSLSNRRNVVPQFLIGAAERRQDSQRTGLADA